MGVFWKSKKGIGFFSLMPLMLILAFLFGLIVYKVPSDDLLEVAEKNNQIILKLDRDEMKLVADDFFKRELIGNNLELILGKVGKLVYLDDEVRKLRVGADCSLDGVNLWYLEGSVSEEVDGKNACLPRFDGGGLDEQFDKTLKKFFETEFRKSFESVFGIEDFKTKISYDEETQKYFVVLESVYGDKNRVAGFNLVNKKEIEVDVSDYKDLLYTLEDVVPKISEYNKRYVLKCLKSAGGESENVAGGIELGCIERSVFKIFEDLGKEDVLRRYDVRISNLDVSSLDNSESLLGLKFSIFDKKTDKFMFDFGVVVKYSIPNDFVKFSVSHSLEFDNVVDVVIEKPTFSNEKVMGYIILYSYDNFFSPSYSQFNNLIELLRRSEIPKKFESQGFVDSFGASYYVSNNKDIDVGVMFLKNEDFVEDEVSGVFNRKVLIYQKFDFDRKKFELLSGGRELYVFVFAVDSNYNYYVEDIENRAKKVDLKRVTGPAPLSLTNFKEIGVSSQDKYYGFEILNFEEMEDVFGFDIYLFRDLSINAIQKGCLGVERCFYGSVGVDELSLSEGRVVISSSSLTSEDTFVYLRNDVFNMGDVGSYGILVVPVNSMGVGYERVVSVSGKIVQNGDFYDVVGGGGAVYTPFSKTGIKIRDDLGPSPLEDIVVDEDLVEKGGKLYLSWRSASDEEINLLSVLVSIYDEGGVLKSSERIVVDRGGDIGVSLSGGVSKVEVSQIFPKDEFGNMMLDGETYFARYVR